MRRLKQFITTIRRLFAADPDVDLQGPGHDLVKLSKRQQEEHWASLREQDRSR